MDQQSRLSATHRSEDILSTYHRQIRRLIANREWNTNLLTEEEFPRLTLQFVKGLNKEIL